MRIRLSGVLFAAALLCVATPLAQAASYFENVPFSFSLSPGGQSVNIDKFDTSLGTLTQALLTINATVGADITAENDSGSPASMGVNLTGFVTGGGATAIVSTSSGPVGVSGTDGISDSGPDFVDFGTISGSNTSNTASLTPLSNYVAFPATWSLALSGSGGFAVTGTSDSSIGISNFGANGTVSVEYIYTPVPEPSTIALAGLGIMGLGAVALRRRRRSA